MNLLIQIIIFVLIGIISGYFIRHYVALYRRDTIENDIEEKIIEAKRKAREIEDEALNRAKEIRVEIEKAEERVEKQEERLDRRDTELTKKEEILSKDTETIRQKAKDLQMVKEILEEKEKNIEKELERVANLSEIDARENFASQNFARIRRRSEFSHLKTFS